jgi:beta-glucosidase
MSSYNDWDGEPITSSYYFLTELLRNQYGFEGYIVSDSEAVEFVSKKHHVASNYKEAVQQVAEAGLNVRTNFTPPSDYIIPLRELVNDGKLSMATLDRNVADVLRVKFQLGLFDSPYLKNPKGADKIVSAPDSKDFMLQMARESIVLLKNADQLLPLNLEKTNNIFVTGPLANDNTPYISRYGPQKIEIVNVLDGIKNYVGNKANITYNKGCEVVDEGYPDSELIPTELTISEVRAIAEAVEKAKLSDVIIAVMGEDEMRCGESKSRTSLALPGRQLQLLQALYKTGKPIVLVLINGRPLTINWENKFIPSILEAWFPNAVGGTAIAETIFGTNNPGGKLTVTFPKSMGQIELNFPFKPASHAGQSNSTDPNGFGNTMAVGALYPFGYGLSYTSFEFSNLKIEKDSLDEIIKINVSVDVKNTGSKNGDEVVQLYFKDVVSSITVYETQLRGFERVSLNAGETKTVHFSLQKTDFELLDKNMKWVVEPGKFEILIGASSEDIRLKSEFWIK